ASIDDREAALTGRQESLEREREQMRELYTTLQQETQKISEARAAFDARLGEAEARERELIRREQALVGLEERVWGQEPLPSERQKEPADRERNAPARVKDLDPREAKVDSDTAALATRQ